jgi:hypothetical protein
MFPFLLRHLAPEKVNSYTLAALRDDTGAGQHVSFWQLLKFPVFAALDPKHPGFWQFLGPLILCFAPLLILAISKTATSRVTLTVWIVGALGIGFSSGMPRFLLPLLPIALAATFAGVSGLTARGWLAARLVCAATIGVFLLFGAASLALYDHAALLTAVGLISEQDYKREHVPEYATTEFINSALQEKKLDGKALVFVRHLFYLRVPFLYGDPSSSWAVDPSRLQTPEEWRAFFQAENVRWVVRSPEYPEAIAAPLTELERTGQLSQIAQAEVSEFQGSRIYGQRQKIVVTILRVQN